jgi:hypothetical protein
LRLRSVEREYVDEDDVVEEESVDVVVDDEVEEELEEEVVVLCLEPLCCFERGGTCGSSSWCGIDVDSHSC